MSIIDPILARSLACPRDQLALHENDGALECKGGHVYPVVEGVPVLLQDDVPQTIGVARASLDAARRHAGGDFADAPYYVTTLGLSDGQRAALLKSRDSAIDRVAQFLVAATNGLLYEHLVGQLESYPIPVLRVPAASGGRFLDIGCSWGRWSLAAAIKGFDVVGLDPSLGAVLAARRIARQLGVELRVVVGDARFMPFRNESFDYAFSYSVLQHFSRDDAQTALQEIGRVLRPGGRTMVQMPNRLGLRCLYHQMRRGFREGREFEVRYWSIPQLERCFSSTIGPAQISVDGFFGLGLQPSDAKLLGPMQRIVVAASERLRAMAQHLPGLCQVADSLYVSAARTQTEPPFSADTA